MLAIVSPCLTSPIATQVYIIVSAFFPKCQLFFGTAGKPETLNPEPILQMTKKEAKYPLPIREWSEDDRPREKLLKYGEHTLRNVYPVESITIPLGLSFWPL